MQTDPYSIVVEHRPCKVAFLVAPNANVELIDEIVRYNRRRWGGQYNPIVLTDGADIEPQWWTFLREYDPDIIRATLPLSDGLRKKIHTFLSPLEVELYREHGHEVYLTNDPLSILPNKATVTRVAQDFLGLESSLVLFETEQGAPAIIRKFLERNFGLINAGREGLYEEQEALKELKTLSYQIRSFNSLSTALSELSEYHRRVVFPSGQVQQAV